jgi:hypothetical protein
LCGFSFSATPGRRRGYDARSANSFFFIFFILLSRRSWHDARSEQFFFLMNEPLPRWVDTVKPELLALVVDQFC